MAFLDEIVAYLDTQLAGYTAGTNLMAGEMPQDPAVCIAVYETAGIAPTYGFGQAQPAFRSPGITVVVRGAVEDRSGPRAAAELAWKALAAVQAQTLSGTFYHWINPLQEPFPLKRDESKRQLFTFNCLCEREAP